MPETFEEILDICLKKIENGSATLNECIADFPEYQNELKEMLPLVVSVESLRQIRPSKQFTRQTVNRLISKMQDPPVTLWARFRLLFQRQTYLQNRSNKMPQIIVSIIIALSLVFGGSFVVEASGPGDLFYELDRNIEQFRLKLTSSSEKALTLRMQNASERLDEAYKKLQNGDAENALKALKEYNKAVEEIKSQEKIQLREETRTMTQEEGALQAGTLERIRLNQPEDVQKRNAFQEELRRANMGQEQLFGPPEEAPYGPSEEVPNGPGSEDAQGPIKDAPQGPNEDAPQGPADDAPNGPNNGKP